MQKEKTVKTKLAPKIVALLFLCVVGALLIVRTTTQHDICSTDTNELTVSAENLSFQTMIAETNESRKLGLSGRRCLGQSSAMLFVFDGLARHGIWMKDMQFAIDIIWLDADKKIVDIKENADPDTYPEVFYPKQPARYVLEINSGQSTLAGMTVGDTLRW